jgi:molybdenum cofactor cytidylyltransferase
MATGQPGNPVILPRIPFRSLDQLEGDTGARKVIAASGLDVVGVEIGLAAVCDIDTPEALDAAGGSEPRA